MAAPAPMPTALDHLPLAMFGLKNNTTHCESLKVKAMDLYVVLTRPPDDGRGGLLCLSGRMCVAVQLSGSRAHPQKKESRSPSGDQVSSHCSQLLPIRPNIHNPGLCLYHNNSPMSVQI